MKQEEALQIIKQVIDAALKAGIFNNLESVVSVNAAFLEISKQK